MVDHRRPNVLVVLADQLRACSVGYAGEEAVQTPALDRFASEGVVFRNAVSMLPVCTPYRGSLLTGRTPLSTGLVLNDIPLKTTEVSIADCFKAAGYDTAYVGKWHLNGPDRLAPVPPGPQRQGFDHWMAANFEHNYNRSHYTDHGGHIQMWDGWDVEAQTSHVIDYLQAHRADNPFCLFLSWGSPHHPYRLVPQRYLDRYDSAAISARPNCPDVPRDDLRGYYAQITFLDDQLGRLLGELDRLALRDDTIVAFTSDHGDMHGSHGVYKKQWPWNESIKIPFVLRYPRAAARTNVIGAPLNVVDVMPTLLDLAGVPVPDRVEGVSLAPLIRNENDAVVPESALIMNPCPFSIGDPRGDDQYPEFRGMRLEYRGVTTDRYTYVRTIDKPWLLYDNIEDPFQMNNLIRNPESTSVLRQLESMLQGHLKKLGDEFLPREAYYEKFNLDIDDRGKVTGIIENTYDRLG